MNKPQIVFIHGGDAFRDVEQLYTMLRGRSFNPYETKQKWQEVLFAQLGDTHECHALRMPNPQWADYEAWKIWFEKMVPFLRAGAVLIGHSLGGSFLLRYLSENTIPVPVAQLHLVAPVVLPFPDCEGFVIATDTWAGFASTIDSVHLWHSADDAIVPIAHSEALFALYPAASLHRFTDRFHFIGTDFPELAAVIKG